MAVDLVRRVALEWNLPATTSKRGGRRKGQRGGPWGASGVALWPNDPMRTFAAMMIYYAVDDWRQGRDAEDAREFLLSPECEALCDFVDVFTVETLRRLLAIGPENV